MKKLNSSKVVIQSNTSETLYAKRKDIYPRQTHGLFTALRVTSIVVLLGIYYILPWISWGDRKAVLFDLPNRKFYIFDIVYWPQDFFYLALILIIATYILFFVTAIAGRLWCGFACPQSVWTEVFIWIERFVEGNSSQQIRLNQQPLNWNKIRLKVSKHFLWCTLAVVTDYTFVAYFVPIESLLTRTLENSLGPWETFWISFFFLATYGNAGWLREQVCIYMCPYARFQGAMFDSDTLIISYDRRRGEPRGARKRGVDPEKIGMGSCINCYLCLRVCPTGIDIRDGLQYQCIGCAACIDVCNEVMGKMHYKKGLIRYTTEKLLAGKRTRIIRPRIVIYSLILAFFLFILVVALNMRIPLGLDVIRDRNALYRQLNNGIIENIYTLKIANMTEKPRLFHLHVAGLPKLQHNLDGQTIAVPANSVLAISEQARMPATQLKKAVNKIQFTIVADDNNHHQSVQETRFIGPRQRINTVDEQQ